VSRPAICLVAVSNRHIPAAKKAYMDGGVSDVRVAKSMVEVERGIREGRGIVTDDPALLCEAEGIDAVIEATGTIDFGARNVMRAMKCRKHVVLMNAELDATLGPILKVHADRAGVVITDTDGDEPGVAMNLIRFVRTIGFQSVMAGNLKGVYDPHRTPETQREFAEKYRQNPKAVTSFVDGTKLSMELAVLGNALGFGVGKRGMFGPHCGHVKDIPNVFDLEQYLTGGVVDYLLGAEPGTGAFVVGYSDQPIKQQYLKYMKMGNGPFYVFYTPFHLPHLELPLTVARAVLFNDATIAPRGVPVCEVITMAKRDLKAGEILDGIGGFTCYGMIENSLASRAEALLPMGLSGGCRVIKNIEMDNAISYEDVEVPEGRYSDYLYAEQNDHFPATNNAN
jgi:predicted homoserine dehydrogenase-like protein